jgi:hypothetical protein
MNAVVVTYSTIKNDVRRFLWSLKLVDILKQKYQMVGQIWTLLKGFLLEYITSVEVVKDTHTVASWPLGNSKISLIQKSEQDLNFAKDFQKHKKQK